MKYQFKTAKKCPLVKQFGKPIMYHEGKECVGFESDSRWLPTIDRRCWECPFFTRNYGGLAESSLLHQS